MHELRLTQANKKNKAREGYLFLRLYIISYACINSPLCLDFRHLIRSSFQYHTPPKGKLEGCVLFKK